MQSNIDCITDDLNEFPDSWIELYNDSDDEEVNMWNWAISIEPEYRSGRLIRVEISMAPKSYLLIYADRATTGLHTHFRLESGNGGAVYLFNERGELSDAITNIPRQPAPNIAYGRTSDGGDTWMHFVTATPGAENTGKTSNVLLPSPVFSQPGGIYNDAVQLTLSLPAYVPNGVDLSTIHYTLDNSEPTLDSPVYTEELTISETTVVRAKLIHPDYLAMRATVHTYIIAEKELALPVISISTDSAYLWDEELGIYCQGNGEEPNWDNDWRRPVNFEYFTSESNTSVLNQLCEIRIAGQWTRMYPQKSLIVYGNKRFGTSRFNYDLFKEKPGQEIKSFMVRNSGQDFWTTHFRDAAIQLFMGGKVNIDYQAYQPAILFLNGRYWGIQNLRERTEEDFVLANYGTEDIDVVSSWGGVLKEGDLVAWNELMDELRKTPEQRNIQWIMDQVDIDEFINYMILQIFVSNFDFPHNNVIMWRLRSIGAKWRFILKDLDYGLGASLVTHNAMVYNTESDDDNRKLFNALLTHDVYRKEFYRRFAIYMGDLLHYSSTSHVIDSIQTMLEPAFPEHLARFADEMGWGSMDVWYRNITDMKTWCRNRNPIVYGHLRDFFELGTIMQLSFKYPDDLSGTPKVFINGVTIRDKGLDASYFQNDTLHLRYDGKKVSHGWTITKTVNNVKTTDTFFQQDLVYTVDAGCTALEIELTDNPNATEQTASSGIRMWLFNNQLYISNLQHPSVITVYDIHGRIISTTTTTDASVAIPFNQRGMMIVKVENKSHRIVRKVMAGT